jgi:Tol biopolymer transport system component
LAGAGIAFVLNTFPVRSLPPPGTVPDFHQLRVSRITSTGNVREAVISPDGKYIAYVELINGQQSLWIRQAASASKVQILPPAAVSLRGLAFSPDGNFVYYLKSAEDGANTLYYLPVLGGLPKEVLTGIESQVSFSPDGRRIAFVRWQQNPRGSLLMTANADGTGQQQLASRRSPEFFSNGGGPAWSPDGEVVAVTAGSSRAGVLFNVVGVRVDGRGEQPITSRAIASITGASWLPDGSGMIITAADQERMSCSNNQLWHVGYPGGAIRRVTNDLNNYGQASVTADASALLTTAEEQFSGIWVKGSDKAGSRAVRLNSGRNDGRAGLSWVPGGGIVYSSDGGGVDSILVMQADGGSPRTLVSHMLNMTPAVSPDGRMILFVSFRGGVPGLMEDAD